MKLTQKHKGMLEKNRFTKTVMGEGTVWFFDAIRRDGSRKGVWYQEPSNNEELLYTTIKKNNNGIWGDIVDIKESPSKDIKVFLTN